MAILFDVFFFVLILFYLPNYLIKRKFDRFFKEKLGFYSREKINELKNSNVIWLHAVSVGEISAAEAILENLKKEFPHSKIVISNTTRGGRAVAEKLAANSDMVIYFPFDISFIVTRAIFRINPKIFILVDTEIWPNMIRALSKRNIPTVLINGRISGRAFEGYSIIRPILKSTFEKIDLLCMQTKLDAIRVEALGARPERIEVAGNLKFDSALKTEKNLSEIKDEFKDIADFIGNSKIFIAGSTHPGEENIILNVFSKLRNESADLKLIIAPRHVERSMDVKALFEKGRYKAMLFSNPNDSKRADILVVDKVGILKRLYAFATLVFVGGSLVRHGGHNILEPAYFSKPVIFGPYIFNFKDIAELFLKNRAAILVSDGNELYLAASRLLSVPEERAALGRRARQLIDENIGAADRIKESINVLLGDKGISL